MYPPLMDINVSSYNKNGENLHLLSAYRLNNDASQVSLSNNLTPG